MFAKFNRIKIGTKVALFGISISVLFVISYLVFVVPSLRGNIEAERVNALKQATEIVSR